MKTKLLTIAIPCYNSAAYMEKAIKSCMADAERIEIIIVDDGSSDATAEIADRYAALYPDTIKAVHKENGGHGDAVMCGLHHATGLYYKVLDSDDWLDERGLRKLLQQLERCVKTGNMIDMFLANYVYERVYEHKSKSMGYGNAFPKDVPFTWNDIRHLHYSQNILMHSVVYRTALLRACGLTLPKHTFYVDNLFVYIPLPYVKKMYYLNTDLYHYFIGRADQSVNEENMIRRIDQQLLVNRIIIDHCNLSADIPKNLKDYLVHYLIMMMTVSTVFLIRSGSAENERKREALWKYLKEKNGDAYKRVNRSFLGYCMQFDSRVGKKVITTGYLASRKIYGFN